MQTKNMEETKINNIASLLAKYESELAEFHVMDDYDGGQYAMMRQVIEDLKGIQENG